MPGQCCCKQLRQIDTARSTPPLRAFVIELRRIGPMYQVKSRFTLLRGKKATCRGSGPDWRTGAGARVWSPLPPGQVKSSCYSPKFIEQTAHCDHKPRAAWVHVRLLLHRRSAAGWAECMIYSALVSFFKIAKKILAPKFFFEKKKIGDKNLAIFCSKNQGV